jgi:hypothetical protein
MPKPGLPSAASVASTSTRPGAWPVGLGLLFAASLLGTLLVVWPEQQEPTAPLAAAVPTRDAAPVPPMPDMNQATAAPALSPDVEEHDGDPVRTLAAMAEPAMLDLLEDAESPDPSVRYEASRLLRDQEEQKNQALVPGFVSP